MGPAFQLTMAPMQVWAHAGSLAEEPGEVPRSLMRRALAMASRPRTRAAGPARAMLVACSRIGWLLIGDVTWATEGGGALDLRVHSPTDMHTLVRAAA